MGKDIQQSVELPASPEALFEMYVDATQHSAFTGGEVTVSRDGDYDGVNQGWRKFYWDPWRAFLDAG